MAKGSGGVATKCKKGKEKGKEVTVEEDLKFKKFTMEMKDEIAANNNGVDELIEKYKMWKLLSVVFTNLVLRWFWGCKGKNPKRIGTGIQERSREKEPSFIVCLV